MPSLTVCVSVHHPVSVSVCQSFESALFPHSLLRPSSNLILSPSLSPSLPPSHAPSLPLFSLPPPHPLSPSHPPSPSPYLTHLPISERQRNKLIALEAKEQENLAMRTMMGRYGQEDNAKAIKKQVREGLGE